MLFIITDDLVAIDRTALMRLALDNAELVAELSRPLERWCEECLTTEGTAHQDDCSQPGLSPGWHLAWSPHDLPVTADQALRQLRQRLAEALELVAPGEQLDLDLDPGQLTIEAVSAIRRDRAAP